MAIYNSIKTGILRSPRWDRTPISSQPNTSQAQSGLGGLPQPERPTQVVLGLGSISLKGARPQCKWRVLNPVSRWLVGALATDRPIDQGHLRAVLKWVTPNQTEERVTRHGGLSGE
jgi:hypothetical protein